MVANKTVITNTTNDDRKTIGEGGVFLQDTAQYQDLRFNIFDSGSTILVGVLTLGLTLLFISFKRKGRKS